MDLDNKGFKMLETTIGIIVTVLVAIIGGIAIYQAVHTEKEDTKCKVKILSTNYEPEHDYYTYNSNTKRMDRHTEGPYYYTYFLYKDKEYCDKSERVYHVAKNKEGKKVKVHAVLLYWDNKSDETKPYNVKIQDFLE